ncbi:MAG: hypothetical protein J2P37_31890, partial [Ktedonobacteraceae bacterium]|nr:hypothetical protein [Ktedonobacteraceae bacterium]
MKACEEVLGWDHCLGAQFPLSALTSLEQLNTAAETAAQITATQLARTMQGSQVEKHASTAHQEIQSVLTLVADPDLRQRCEDLLSADKHYDRVIREACVILEDRVR